LKIQTLYDKVAEAEMEYKIEFTGETSLNQATYICVITTDYGIKYSRLMMIR
jgi:hypothetical protein